MGALVVLIGIGGNFPLNDDWVHAWSVQNFLNGGGLKLLPYTGPLLYFQVLLGAGAAKVFGFSYVTFRGLTLVLGLVALLSLYVLLRKRNVKPVDAFLITSVLAVNPWFVSLSFSFMTDVPALAFLLLACALFVQGYKKESRGWIVAACLAALGSMFIRQSGALFFPAALIALLFAKRTANTRSNFFITLFFGIVGAGSFVLLGNMDLLPAGADVHIFTDARALLIHAAEWLWYGISYIGLFALPILAGIACARRKTFFGVKAWLWLVLSGAITAWFFFVREKYFPYAINIVAHEGLGPTGSTLQGRETEMFPLWIWYGVTALSAIGAAWLMRFGVRAKLRMLKKREFPFGVVLVGTLGAFQIILVLAVTSFDRYLLPAFALFLAYLGMYYGSRLRQVRVITVLGVIAVGVYSVIGTQNYLRWNAVRWHEAETLVTQGISPEHIEAGYEWCGAKLYEKAYGMQDPHDRSKPWYVNSICPLNTGEYVISFSEMPGYDVVKKAKYKSWYDTSPWLFVLKKKN